MKSGKNSKAQRNAELLSHTVQARDIPPSGEIDLIGADVERIYREYPGFEALVARLCKRIASLVSSDSKYERIVAKYGPDGVDRISFIATMYAISALQYLERIMESFALSGDKGKDIKSRYLISLEQPKAAYHFLHVFLFSRDKRKTRDVHEDDLLNHTTPFLLDAMTDEVIRGRSISESIRKYSSWVSKRAEIGDASFFVQFGEWVTKATTRSLAKSFERWLLTGWLPLALWTLSPSEAVTILRVYAKVLRSCGGVPPNLGTDQEVKKNIRRFKMRLMAVERK